MSAIRAAAVAGSFYPAAPEDLRAMVESLLRDAAVGVAAGEPAPKAIIAPHAGYIYSGPIAASAYVRVLPVAERIRRVVLIGPCHRVAVRGLALPSARVFATPLGPVPVDGAAVAEVAALPQVRIVDETHLAEHSLEVHLPFLQCVLPRFSLVPLVAGQASANEVADVLERLWGGDETLIVISSDLSHYLPYEAARASDAVTCRAIEHLDPTPISFDHACGRVPVAGLLVVARRRKMTVRTLDLRNSGDTAGDKRRVVGYGAWMFVETASNGRHAVAGGEEGEAAGRGDGFADATEALLSRHGETLLHLAAASISHGLRYGSTLPVSVADQPADLQQLGASFVTLKRQGQLRGCVGSAQAHRPLAVDVAENGFAASFRDTRFRPLTPEELEGLKISVSVLSPPAPIPFKGERDLLEKLKPGEDGIIIRVNNHRALFLPQVWEQLPQPRQFLDQLKRKAGLPADFWSDDLKAWRFASRSISSEQLAEPGNLWR
jgi:AmmeMemoRadiSam system protein B/AmmeMemoRadiSam system protein A